MRTLGAFQAQIRTLANSHGILRAKGRVPVEGKALPFVVQAVGQRVDGYFAPQHAPVGNDSNAGRLVVIGLAGLDAATIASQLGGSVIMDSGSDASPQN